MMTRCTFSWRWYNKQRSIISKCVLREKLVVGIQHIDSSQGDPALVMKLRRVKWKAKKKKKASELMLHSPPLQSLTINASRSYIRTLQEKYSGTENSNKNGEEWRWKTRERDWYRCLTKGKIPRWDNKDKAKRLRNQFCWWWKCNYRQRNLSISKRRTGW